MSCVEKSESSIDTGNAFEPRSGQDTPMRTTRRGSLHLYSPGKNKRESTGAFDCIGMNSICYTRMAKEKQCVAFGLNASPSMIGKWHVFDKQWNVQNFPPPAPGRFSNKLILVVDCQTHLIIHMNDSASHVLFHQITNNNNNNNNNNNDDNNDNDNEQQSTEQLPSIDSVMDIRYVQWLSEALDACSKTVGAIVVSNSDIVEVKDHRGNSMTVSAYVQKLTRPVLPGQRILSLFVFERCYRYIAHINVAMTDGSLVSHDSEAEVMFGLTDKTENEADGEKKKKTEGEKQAEDDKGENGAVKADEVKISDLLFETGVDRLEPLEVGDTMNVVGKCRSKMYFPLSIEKIADLDGNVSRFQLHVYTIISGLVVINNDGYIVDYNAAFIGLVAGYADDDLIGSHIAKLMPKYEEYIEKQQKYGYASLYDMEPAHSDDINDSINAAKIQSALAKERTCQNNINSSVASPPMKRRRQQRGDSGSANNNNNNAAGCSWRSRREETLFKQAVLKSLLASGKDVDDPSGRKSKSPDRSVPFCAGQGDYVGCLVHRDGMALRVDFSVNSIHDGHYALWLSRPLGDPHTVSLCIDSIPTQLASIKTDDTPGDSSSISYGCSMADDQQQQAEQQQQHSSRHRSYSNSFDNVVELGPGRMGPIYISKRKHGGNDANLVKYITKFVDKSELKTPLRTDESGKKIPSDAYFLAKLNHDNICKLVGVYEDQQYYEIVTARHGEGLDLIGFVALRPCMDEALTSHIFRQITNAVGYIHKQSIVHRKIRPENAVIDRDFNVKLIDFSNAAYEMDVNGNAPFVGNLDYCPPEILLGYKCFGKPLDIWNLGITLYVLMFGYIPFKDPYAIMLNSRIFPNIISDALVSLLADMLCTMPQTRATADQILEHAWTSMPVNPRKYIWEDIVKHGNIQTHIDYHEYQRSPIRRSDDVANNNDDVGNEEDDDDSGHYPALESYSPLAKHMRSDVSANDLLNRTIMDDDEEEDPSSQSNDGALESLTGSSDQLRRERSRDESQPENNDENEK